MWLITKSASCGIESTDELVTSIFNPKDFILFLNFVAPIALDPIPASHANTIFLISLFSASFTSKSSFSPSIASFDSLSIDNVLINIITTTIETIKIAGINPFDTINSLIFFKAFNNPKVNGLIIINPIIANTIPIVPMEKLLTNISNPAGILFSITLSKVFIIYADKGPTIIAPIIITVSVPTINPIVATAAIIPPLYPETIFPPFIEIINGKRYFTIESAKDPNASLWKKPSGITSKVISPQEINTPILAIIIEPKNLTTLWNLDFITPYPSKLIFILLI